MVALSLALMGGKPPMPHFCALEAARSRLGVIARLRFRESRVSPLVKFYSLAKSVLIALGQKDKGALIRNPDGLQCAGAAPLDPI